MSCGSGSDLDPDLYPDLDPDLDPYIIGSPGSGSVIIYGSVSVIIYGSVSVIIYGSVSVIIYGSGSKSLKTDHNMYFFSIFYAEL